jgi:hypothetical protein
MHTLKIRVLSGSEPKLTVTIPLRFVKTASRLIPKRAVEAMREEGIDLNEIVRLADDPEARGEIAVFEDHEKGERTTVSIE